MASTKPSGNTLHKRKTILSLCHLFLSGIKSRDPALMQTLILPSGHAVLTQPSSPSSTTISPSQKPTLHHPPNLIDLNITDSSLEVEENIASAEWEEYDDGELYGGRKAETKVDGDIAVAWTPYVVRIGEKLHHDGTNVWTFMRRIDGEKRGELGFYCVS